MFEMLQYEFIRNAVIAGLLASIACGIIGTFIVMKRIVFVSGGISHAAFGGVGLSLLLRTDPLLGALLFAFLSSIGISVMHRRVRVTEDAAIGILWVTGMALGVIFISFSSGYTSDVFSYLFGSIIAVPRSDLILMSILDIIIVSAAYLLYKEIVAFSFDEEFTAAIGVPVESIYLIFLSLVALTVVLLMKIVGIILVIAMLTIPPTISIQLNHNLKRIIILSVLIAASLITCGLWLSILLDLPSGATIILVSVAALTASSIIRRYAEARMA